MKKIVAALAGLALSLSACQDLQEKDFMKTTALTLTASVEQPVGTRTLIAGDSQVWWEKGDEIKVFAGTKSARFVTDLTSPAATADFSGSLGGAWTEGSPLWAVYPYSDGASLEGETLAVVLPAVQTARGMSFAQNMNLSVARTTTASLQFYNVGGGLCFTLTQEGITKVVFEGLNGETLAGKVKLAFQDERPAVQEVSGGSTAITLAAPEGTTLEKGAWYYIVALPGALEKGFSLSFYKGDAVAKKTFTKAVTVKRSIFGEVRDADEGVSYIPDTDENIAFKDAKVKSIVVRYFDTGKDGELSYKEAAAVRSFFVDEALTRAEGEQVSVFAGTDIETFDEIVYFTGLTKIEDGAFAGCTQLTSITIPANITEIGANAFKGCTGLQSITIEATTPPTIGEGAFSDTNDCPIVVPAGTTETYTTAWGEYAPRIEGGQPDNEIWYTTADGNVVTAEYSEFASFDFGVPLLSNVYENGKGVMTFDGPVTTVGDMAFYSCRNLSGITLPSSVTKIGTHAFDGCFGLTTMTISSGVSQIGDGAFALCKGLISLAVSPDNPVYDSRDNCNAIIHTGTNNLISACLNTKIPSSVVSIGDNAFEGIDIVKLIIPESVKSIGKAAFANCNSLEEVVIPDQLNEIREQAFIYCNALKKISLPSIITSIGEYTFFYCSALTEITIPEGVTSIGYRAFGYCGALTSIKLPESLKSIGKQAFQQCSVLKGLTLPKNVSNIEESAFSSCKGLENLVIEGAAKIGKSAFSSCLGLATITLSAEVDSIGTSAFSSCRNLMSITVQATTPPPGGSRMFNNTNNCPIYVPTGSVEAYKAAEYWSEYADRIQALEPETQPDNEIWYTTTDGQIIEEPGYARLGQKEIRTFGANLLSHEYVGGKGVMTFDGPVTMLGPYAFDGNTTLQTISYPKTVTSIQKRCFNYCPNLSSIEIPEQQTVIEAGTFSSCHSLVNIVLPSALTTIGDQAFVACTGLKAITIPAGVTSIGAAAFTYCSSLSEIVVSQDNPVYDSRGNCNAIIETATNTLRWGSTTIPASVTKIGTMAFAQRSHLKGIAIPEMVTEIGVGAFSECSELETITIPAHVTVLGKQAFYDCPQLKEVIVLAETPPSCGEKVFDNPGQTGSAYPIYVPAESVEAYKTTEGWNTYADRIQAIGPASQPDNEIWYTSTDGQVVLPDNTGAFGANFLSNEYNDGKGVLRFDGPVTKVGEGAFLNCGTLREAILPKTVTTIGDGAFYNAAGLERVHIPKLVSSIGVQVFQKASSIARITVDPENVTYDSREDCNAIIHTATNTLVVGCKNSFIPNNIKRIGDYAFVFCADLTEITIPESVETIGISAFNFCENLTSVSIPSSVTSLGAYAFNSCTSLSGVTIYCQTPPEIGRSCFQNGPSYPIYVPTGLVETYKTAEGWSDYAKRILPMDPQARLNWEISYTSTDGEKVSPSFARYNIPADVAFGGALVVFNSYKDGQGKILFDRDVTELMNSFQLCTNLKTISLPESVTYIGAYTFAGCTNLTGTIKIPQGQVKISNALFSDCSSLEGVVIPEGVTSIGARVFSGCTSLTELTFPSSLKAISNSVASGCSGLTRITVLAETPPTGSSSMFTGSNCPIYVPAASVADYKAAAYWSDYADRIQALP